MRSHNRINSSQPYIIYSWNKLLVASAITRSLWNRDFHRDTTAIEFIQMNQPSIAINDVLISLMILAEMALAKHSMQAFRIHLNYLCQKIP